MAGMIFQKAAFELVYINFSFIQLVQLNTE